jgi:predicted glycoside hydrolase/deacetylase ChbG (UPF0249 family)
MRDLKVQLKKHITQHLAKAKVRPSSLVERLGYERDARLLIVHADDVGMIHSVNAACFHALASGLVNSASIMVPCPCFPEAAAFAREHPELDLGIHLTLTSERPTYRWGPVMPPEEVPSLVGPDGYFHRPWVREICINPREAELELRAQIEKGYAAGLRPTHFDSHHARLQSTDRVLFEIYLRLGREFGLPVLNAHNWLAAAPSRYNLLDRDDIVIDRVITIEPDISAERWPQFYRHAVETLTPGVTEFLIHPGWNDAELRAFSQNSPNWGAEWRQRDFDFFTGDEFRDLLARHELRLITWREIGERLLRNGGADGRGRS